MWGVVTDASGAVLKRATVTVTNERTNEKRSVVSNENGDYVITQLEPSEYTRQGSASGFSETKIKGISLQVGQEVNKTLVLPVAGTNVEVTVDGGALASVDTSSAKVGVNVSEREVAQLPLNGRQVSQLYLLAPGAVNSGGGNFDNIRFSGRSNQQNIIRFDGIEGSSIIDASRGNLNGEI